MQRIFYWVKQHPFQTGLVLVILWLAWPRIEATYYNLQYRTSSSQNTMYDTVSPGNKALEYSGSPSSSYAPSYAPTDTTDRMVSQNASLSMVVKNVEETNQAILLYTKNLGGYMVSNSLSSPNDAAYATLTVRVPSENLDDALSYFRSQSLNTTAENITGNDVTDQYSNLDALIANLTATKTRYEQIRESATEISDLVDVTREITSIQNQIDSYVGQQTYLEQIAKYSLISIDMSTDELALPFAPKDTFRPALIFRQAVRSLLTFMQTLAGNAIWLSVYAIVWVPVLIVFLWWYKKTRPKLQKKT